MFSAPQPSVKARGSTMKNIKTIKDYKKGQEKVEGCGYCRKMDKLNYILFSQGEALDASLSLKTNIRLNIERQYFQVLL